MGLYKGDHNKSLMTLTIIASTLYNCSYYARIIAEVLFVLIALSKLLTSVEHFMYL